VIIVSGYAGRPGNTFTEPLYENGYYMQTNNSVTAITNNIILENGTSGSALTDSYTTDVTQTCDFYFGAAIGSIKMSTSATFKYLIVVQNLGNVWDRFYLYTDPDNPEYADCVNPDGSPSTGNQVLYNDVLDLDDQTITVTPWLAPGETYSFYLMLTTPPGTSANRWNCTNLTITSDVCGRNETKTFHTETINPPSEPNLFIYKVDYPDPVGCDDILNYSIFITNLGSKEAYNTVVTENYDQSLEFISSTPAPDAGTDNSWTLGNIPINGYQKIDIIMSIKEGVFNGQEILNEVTVNYDDGAQTPEYFSNSASASTTVTAYPDLVIDKSASPVSVKLGEIITYTINYYNDNCGTGTQIIIEDDYDEAHTEVVDDGGGIVADGKITFNIGALTPEQGVQTLIYSVRVTDVDCGAVQIVNDALISSLEPDQNIANNSISTSVLATSAPEWTLFPDNVTVECDDVPGVAVIGQAADVWATDACLREVTITYLGETITEGSCGGNYTITRTWKAEDDYGNFSERSQVITVEDTTEPVINCPSFEGYETTVDGIGHITVTLEANSGQTYVVTGSDFDATATDNCDNSSTLVYSLAGITTGSGVTLNGLAFNQGTTEVTWNATDHCANENNCSFTVVVNADPDVSLYKTLLDINGNSGSTQYTDIDDVLNYNFTIENTGDVTLYDVTLSDPVANVTGTVIEELAPGEINTSAYTASYTITQADLDLGYFTNTATISGQAGNGSEASDSDSETVFSVQAASVTIAKTSTVSEPYDQVGDILTYNIVVTNTGNVTLTDLVVTDETADLSSTDIAFLNPGSSSTITASYTVTQDDLDEGQVVNTASVTGTYLDETSEPQTVSDTDSETVMADQEPGINVLKTASASTYSTVGEQLSFSVEITNSGNVTITDINITDELTGDNWTIDLLIPGESETFSTDYLVSQTELDEGSVTNTVMAAGLDPADVTITSSGNVTLTALQDASLTVSKSVDQQDYVSIND